MEDMELLCEVSRLYYENNLTQNEIAKHVHTSRSTISRLLQEARERGIVEITIHYPWDRSPQLEQELQSRFGLLDIRILDSRARKGEDAYRGVYTLAARYLQSVLKENTTLGISWGRAMHHTIQMLRPEHKLPIKVIQLFGAANASNRLTDGPDLVRQVGNLYGGECHFIHAPLFVENPQAREALLQDKHIQQTLTLAQHADIVLTGIGALELGSVHGQTSTSYLSREAMKELLACGSIGHICNQHYDINGQLLETNIHNCLIGVTLASLRNIRQVIGVACGDAKAAPILGALRGKHINTLITDDGTARKVLALDGKS